MAKKQDPLEKSKNKLDLTATLNAIDFKNKQYYNNLDDNLKKQYAAFVIMRFMSSMPDQGGYHELSILNVNDLVNQDFWVLSKYPDFQHLLLTLTGLGRKSYHQWIAAPKREIKDKVKTFLSEIYRGYNDLEYQLLYRQLTVEDFEDLCRQYALDDKEIKELSTNFKLLKDENA